MNPIPVIIMLPPRGGSTVAESWMAHARYAAALDLIDRLNCVPEVAAIQVLAADPVDRDALRSASVELVEPSGDPFHFGHVLASFGQQQRGLAYFGGASAPLLTATVLKQLFQQMQDWQGKRALVNNRHSSDWLLISTAGMLESLAPHLPNDNALGWVLETQAGFYVETTASTAAMRCDIDTPADVCLAGSHPDAGPHLKRFLQQNPVTLLDRLADLRSVLQTPASSVALIGRTSSEAWSALVGATRIWVRVYAEERGMTASGRQERGEARSLLASAMEAMGEDAFMVMLAGMLDGVLWDTRVWMAHHHIWPSDADRFAADLGMIDQIQNRALRQLTAAQSDAGIPMIVGGHGVVGGSLLALVETISYQPSR